MVDCRPGAAAAHELAHAHAHPAHAHNSHAHAHPANGDSHNPQAAGDMSAHSLASPGAPAPGRIATPGAAPLAAYPGVPLAGAGAGYGYGACGVKSLVWCAPPPPPPPPVNPHVGKSLQPSGADLPMHDIPTLRYYFNLGVDCMWAAYGPPQRHYSPRDLSQDMQQMSLGERGPAPNGHEHKHKPGDKPPPKGNGQRPLLGPRFKRGNQDGNGSNNHANKPHNNNNNNNMANNKGPNNRRNSQASPRAPAGYEEEAALLPLPYMPYPPPLYPVPYYPVEEPAFPPGMLGMLGGVGYVGYEEGAEFAAPLPPYYPAHYPPPPHPHHLDHK